MDTAGTRYLYFGLDQILVPFYMFNRRVCNWVLIIQLSILASLWLWGVYLTTKKGMQCGSLFFSLVQLHGRSWGRFN